MIPAYNKKRCVAVPFETGIHFRRKTDFFPEEDTTKSYTGFEPIRLQAEGESQWLSGSALRFHATSLEFESHTGQGRLNPSSLQWVNK
ncbi:hypothetical protein TNCV_1370181 [Trichonephila clavipes]|nr:hypothetical protein TNCV_1370181 [Trichonephila clavipes]